jgi:hypothetical protein
VIAGVGNYVIENPSNLGNYVIADNRTDAGSRHVTKRLRPGGNMGGWHPDTWNESMQRYHHGLPWTGHAALR